MVISLDEYDRILAQMPKTNLGDEITLTAEDEAALDRAWENTRVKKESAANAPADDTPNDAQS